MESGNLFQNQNQNQQIAEDETSSSLIDSSLQISSFEAVPPVAHGWNQDFLLDSRSSDRNMHSNYGTQVINQSASEHQNHINYSSATGMGMGSWCLSDFDMHMLQPPHPLTNVKQEILPIADAGAPPCLEHFQSFSAKKGLTLGAPANLPNYEVTASSHGHFPRIHHDFGSSSGMSMLDFMAAQSKQQELQRILHSCSSSSSSSCPPPHFLQDSKPNLLLHGASHPRNSGLGKESTESSSNGSEHQKRINSECPVTAVTGADAAAGSTASKKPRIESVSAVPSFKLSLQVRKEKLGDRITALQQLVSPFGKTDTASVLLEAIGYIKFLQEQVRTLSTPYMEGGRAVASTSSHGGASAVAVGHPHTPTQAQPERESGSSSSSGEKAGKAQDLRSRGLCLVPVSYTLHVTNSDNGADFWSPGTLGGSFR